MALPLCLIIEDDSFAADIFRAALDDANYDTVVIRDGQEALEKLQELVPVLIVLDLRLPTIPGVRLLMYIRNSEHLNNTKVIVVSADATLTNYVREQADLVLVKPIGYNQLSEMASRMKGDYSA